MTRTFDLAIIGGGINGCGIAADAAMRGLSTVLIEQGDLASQSSSASTKLIHGGLRYLEQYDFRLVKKSLNERQTLLDLAPHLIRPIPFVIPHSPKTRPAWLFTIGLWIYDHLSRKNRLPRSCYIQREQHQSIFSPLNQTFNRAHMYYDCATDDARLTLQNALLAKEHNALILPRTLLEKGEFENKHWTLTVKPLNQASYTLTSRVVVNAAGARVNEVNTRLGLSHYHQVDWIKGSHLVVKKLYAGHHGYLLQHDDQRIIFVIPFHDHTLIGTTDISIRSLQDPLEISPAEISYLLKSVNGYFQNTINENDIVTSWSGIRTLLASNKTPQQISRDYLIHFQPKPAPALCIYSGKITTYRQLALEALNYLKPLFPHLRLCATHHTLLPGANFKHVDLMPYISWVPHRLLNRWETSYGARMHIFLSNCNQISDLGIHFGANLYQREVDYLIKEEWASSAEDILWRRTKLGLVFAQDECRMLEDYLVRVHAVEKKANI